MANLETSISMLTRKYQILKLKTVSEVNNELSMKFDDEIKVCQGVMGWFLSAGLSSERRFYSHTDPVTGYKTRLLGYGSRTDIKCNCLLQRLSGGFIRHYESLGAPNFRI